MKAPESMAANPLEKGRIVVTGGAGFIGSALIWALNRRGIDNILVVDLLGEGDKYRNLVPLKFADYMEADAFLRAVEERSNLFHDVQALIHLGACSSTTETDGRYLMENNFGYTKRLASWVVPKSIRFVYASSAATYGDGQAGMDDRSAGSLDALRPLNLYGYSKHLFDLWARRRGLLSRIAGVKYFNVFGPNEAHKGDMRSMVAKACEQIRESGTVGLFKSHHPDYPDGGQERDFLYVKDAVEMTLHLTEDPAANGIFNLGSGRTHTWIDLVSPIFEVLGQERKIEFIEMPEALRGKYQYHTCADIGKLRNSGFKTDTTPLADAVRDYVRHYLVPDVRLGDGEGAGEARSPLAGAV